MIPDAKCFCVGIEILDGLPITRTWDDQGEPPVLVVYNFEIGQYTTREIPEYLQHCGYVG